MLVAGAQLHGRNLKQEEVWEALGYGRVGRNATQEVVKKQKDFVEKLSQVPTHRDLRLIKEKKKREEALKERRKTKSMGHEAPRVEEDEDGNKLTGVKRLVKRIEKRTGRLSEGADDRERAELLVGKDNGKQR